MCSELLLRALGSQTEGTSATPELPRIAMLEPASRRSLSTQAGTHSTAPTVWGTVGQPDPWTHSISLDQNLYCTHLSSFLFVCFVSFCFVFEMGLTWSRLVSNLLSSKYNLELLSSCPHLPRAVNTGVCLHA